MAESIPTPSTPLRIKLGMAILWLMLASGVGGLALFAMIAVDRMPPSRVIGWPIISAISATVGAWGLRRIARGSKSVARGSWHLSMADLMAATLFAALIMSLLRSLNSVSLFPGGVVVTVCLTLLFVLGLLAAGYYRAKLRLVFAIGFVLTVFGSLAMGSFLSLSVFLSFTERSAPVVRMWMILLGFESEPFGGSALLPFRIALGAIPVGLILCRRSGRLSAPPPAAPATAKQTSVPGDH